MTGKQLLKRVLLTLGLTAGLLMMLAAMDAEATPIRPDIRKVVTQAQEDSSASSMPARAGWDGPEMPVTQQATAALDAARLAREERAEWIAVATPDPRAILGIVAVIFLLRLLREQDEKRMNLRVVPTPPMEKNEDRLAA